MALQKSKAENVINGQAAQKRGQRDQLKSVTWLNRFKLILPPPPHHPAVIVKYCLSVSVFLLSITTSTARGLGLAVQADKRSREVSRSALL